MHENCKHVILAKTLKIMFPSKRDAYFEAIDVAQKPKNQAKINKKMHVFCDVVFAWILEGFWDGFGKRKSLIFAFFWNIFSIQIDIKLKLAKKCKEKRKLVPPAGGRDAPRWLTPPRKNLHDGVLARFH